MKNKVYAGYINLRPINGVIFPSYSQNQINKNFIEQNLKGKFFLSTNENMYSKNDIVLNSLIKEKNKLNGVVMLSAFSLPQEFSRRKEIFKNLLKNKKTLHFVFEEFKFKEKKDINQIEEYLMFTENFFTKKKSSLTKQENKLFSDKNWMFV
jgi:sporadic carbohydrate cluster protein (TIGR04323 family)